MLNAEFMPFLGHSVAHLPSNNLIILLLWPMLFKYPKEVLLGWRENPDNKQNGVMPLKQILGKRCAFLCKGADCFKKKKKKRRSSAAIG